MVVVAVAVTEVVAVVGVVSVAVAGSVEVLLSIMGNSVRTWCNSFNFINKIHSI